MMPCLVPLGAYWDAAVTWNKYVQLYLASRPLIATRNRDTVISLLSSLSAGRMVATAGAVVVMAAPVAAVAA